MTHATIRSHQNALANSQLLGKFENLPKARVHTFGVRSGRFVLIEKPTSCLRRIWIAVLKLFGVIKTNSQSIATLKRLTATHLNKPEYKAWIEAKTKTNNLGTETLNENDEPKAADPKAAPLATRTRRTSTRRALRQEVVDLKRQLEAEKAQKTNPEQLETVEKKLKETEEKLRVAEGLAKANKALANKVVQEHTKMKDSNAQHQKTVEELNAKIKALETKLSASEEAIQPHKTELETLKKRLQTSQAIAQNPGTPQKQKTGANKKIQELNTKIANTAKQLQTAEKERDELKAKLQQTQQAFAKHLETKIEVLKANSSDSVASASSTAPVPATDQRGPKPVPPPKRPMGTLTQTIVPSLVNVPEQHQPPKEPQALFSVSLPPLSSASSTNDGQSTIETGSPKKPSEDLINQETFSESDTPKEELSTLQSRVTLEKAATPPSTRFSKERESKDAVTNVLNSLPPRHVPFAGSDRRVVTDSPAAKPTRRPLDAELKEQGSIDTDDQQMTPQPTRTMRSLPLPDFSSLSTEAPQTPVSSRTRSLSLDYGSGLDMDFSTNFRSTRVESDSPSKPSTHQRLALSDDDKFPISPDLAELENISDINSSASESETPTEPVVVGTKQHRVQTSTSNRWNSNSYSADMPAVPTQRFVQPLDKRSFLSRASGFGSLQPTSFGLSSSTLSRLPLRSRNFSDFQ